MASCLSFSSLSPCFVVPLSLLPCSPSSVLASPSDIAPLSLPPAGHAFGGGRRESADHSQASHGGEANLHKCGGSLPNPQQECISRRRWRGASNCNALLAGWPSWYHGGGGGGCTQVDLFMLHSRFCPYMVNRGGAIRHSMVVWRETLLPTTFGGSHLYAPAHI